MAGKKSSATDRLEAIRKRLQTTDLGGGSDFWKPKTGDNQIRILPGVGEMGDIFWTDVGTHYFKVGGEYKVLLCPDFTAGAGDRCPICEYVSELRATKDPADAEIVDQIKLSKGFAMNVIVRDQEEKGPQVFSAGTMIMQQIAGLLGDDEYGDLLLDVDEGLDITITKSGKARQTKYNVTARRRATPLSKDPDLADSWLDKALDLTPVMLTEDPSEDAEIFRPGGVQTYIFGVMPYDRLLREFEGVAFGDGDEEADEDDEDDDEDEDVLDEDEDEDDEDEDEDDGDEVHAAIARRRSSKRSPKAPAAPPTKSKSVPRRRAR